LTSDGTVGKIGQFIVDQLKGVLSVFPFLHPRVPNFVLGLAIGLSVALVYHWAAWAIH
jgi:hypothetical protein